MEDRRFDALTRTLAEGRSRRHLLKGLLGLGLSAVGVRSFDNASAARRPAPTPKPVSCPGEQTWDSSQCICPAGKVNCGADCCTPGVSECCDGACCFGNCYAEELCCPTGTIFCNGSCIEGACCTDADCGEGIVCDPESHTCGTACVPDCEGKFCGDDGCGGRCGTCLETAGCGEDSTCHQCTGCGVGELCGSNCGYICVGASALCLSIDPADYGDNCETHADCPADRYCGQGCERGWCLPRCDA